MIAQCPICENKSYTHSFPFETFWNKKIFQYLKCKNCKCTYVHPLPTDKDFEKMYNKEAYHDVHYKNNDINNYKRSLSFLSQFSNNKKTLLDYGCGDGLFLSLCKKYGFDSTGVEIDNKIIEYAKLKSKCPIYNIRDLNKKKIKFDIIHLGDVLEHTSKPYDLMIQLENFLNKNGIFFIEGPIEKNPSLVFFCSYLFGNMMKILKIKKISKHSPTHLFFVSSNNMKYFFNSKLGYIEKKFDVYETGWPYISQNKYPLSIKTIIGLFAKILGGIKIGKFIFGNRFYAIYKPK